MSSPTVRESYDHFSKLPDQHGGTLGDIDHMLCEVVTRILEIPEVKRAVIVAGLRSNAYIKHADLDSMDDLPFHLLWNHLMTKLDTLDEKE